ncbi:MAG: transglycosylase SLT domain-containing protein [Paludibacter sp.]|nr:transglycosylase SLT domain-containing protein [Paludibacter sp.]MDD4198059.1 transglycosylase SLT domain-containing protein [Paludibacter sp.]MDD4427034.1 transglycosylase SLT domain-containing protein [Paludibacter sp.]
MFLKKIFVFALFLQGVTAVAQSDINILKEGKSTLQSDTVQVPDEVTYALDHMLSNWFVSKSRKFQCDTTHFDHHVPDSVISKRLRLMPCVMEMPFNGYVRSFVDLYTVKRKNQLSYLQGLGEYYFRLFEQILDKNKLPLELKYLPVIESALNPTAISRAGAAGLWQFMTSTGRMYGLEINSLVDERMDPYKSTHAAAKYLKDLYDIYGDWHLVIAAYNCGPGNVNKAVRRAGGKQDYWTIYPFLPAETRGYVPIFIAANYAMYYADAHNICKATIEFPRAVDTVVINQRVHFEQIASVLNVPKEQIKMMNPQYRREIIPGDLKPYAVVLPVKMTGMFIDKFEDIVAYKADSLINNRRAEVNIPQATAASGGKVIYHMVRKGQTLSSIAARYGVSVSRIRKWNNLKGSMIRPGQRLKINK